MQCTSPIIMLGKGYFPCGKCLNCRIARSREWSSRLVQELPYWQHSVFITLTYDDEHLPSDYGLHKEVLQKFFKRLRKRCKANGIDKIKYYACGEYGDENIDKITGLYKYPTKLGRPHYHAIIFGLGSDSLSKDLVKQSWTFCNWKVFQDKKCFGTVTYDSCRYVADYIFKKYDKVKAQEVYGNLQVPFRLSSLGFGLRFALDNSEQLRKNVGFTINGVQVALPRYYMNKLGIKTDRHYSKSFEQWCNYSTLLYGNSSMASSLYYEHMEQRCLNTQKRADMHKKGQL